MNAVSLMTLFLPQHLSRTLLQLADYSGGESLSPYDLLLLLSVPELRLSLHDALI